MSSKTQLAVGLDAGSGRTRCVICAIENGGSVTCLMASRPPRDG